jgi:hypothetical protein
MQVFLSAVDRDANNDLVSLYQDRVRRNANGGLGFNWATDMPHVTQNVPQNCTRCHADQDNACDDSKARETYGFGTGRFMFTDENAVSYDLTQLLDAAGDPIVEFSHEGQSEVPRAMRDRALTVCVPDQPR